MDAERFCLLWGVRAVEAEAAVRSSCSLFVDSVLVVVELQKV